jgi:aspartyl-tRNA(Asn)/glutamyl-tRNA(Gln) amidotransferase subunit C
MKLSVDQVKEVAALARLGLSTEELETFTGQLEAILHYMKQLEEVDTSEVEATSHALPLTCPLREDAIRASIPRERLLGPSPQREAEFFRVPKIIE